MADALLLTVCGPELLQHARARREVPEVGAERGGDARGSGGRLGAPGSAAGVALVSTWWRSDEVLACDETVPQIVYA